ncbi:MAG: type II toxin-antitoxin system mRNA interferase toxin, RelE/StbE family [Proteobacteria bacterium]|nr:type II toxin-antitoxin system mRNA interferase toxin, RelE/StbE family [Pseudomonadota bacterium]NDG27023.1 type II toxin-antitoxin system mRNA interferase toxin, RelE/StbE family [Pseudomonadota bacterium]
MWTIFEKRSVVKVLEKAPKEIVIRYEGWKRIVELRGPDGLRQVKGFHDEQLKGKWAGFRPSRLGIQWRVIYLVKGESLEVLGIELTSHDYRRT